MNNYLETIDEAISQVHSRRSRDDYYTIYEYNRDLQGLIELRSFVEKQQALKLYVQDLGWLGARVTLASSYESAIETLHVESLKILERNSTQSDADYTSAIADMRAMSYPYGFTPEHLSIYPAVDGAFIETEGN